MAKHYGNIELQEQDDDYEDIAALGAQNIEPQEQHDDDDNNIYANVETKTMSTAQGKDSQSGKRRYRCVAISFGLLCGVLALLSIGAPLYLYHSNMVERDQWNNNLTEERGKFQTSFDQLMTRYNHLTKQKDQLQTSFDQLKTSLNNLTDERDDMKMRLCESPGWQKFDRGCYYISTGEKNWEDSRQWCRDRQSDLIVIKSKEVQDFVERVNKRVWLGLTDRDTEGSFKWVDGTPLTSPTYWSSGNPNNQGEGQDCVEFSDGSNPPPTRGWNDMRCSTHNIYWICERVMC